MAFVTPGRAGLSGNLPLSPRERLFHLKIIECGKCWIWKLFIGFPFLFLPPAGPAVASRAGRLCSGFRANWAGASGFPADEPRAAGAAIVVKGPPSVRALGREAGLADWMCRRPHRPSDSSLSLTRCLRPPTPQGTKPSTQPSPSSVCSGASFFSPSPTPSPRDHANSFKSVLASQARSHRPPNTLETVSSVLLDVYAPSHPSSDYTPA